MFLSNINEPCKLLFEVMYTLSSVKPGFHYDISTSITVKQNKTFCSACACVMLVVVRVLPTCTCAYAYVVGVFTTIMLMLVLMSW